MKAPTKRALNAKMVHYRQLSSERKRALDTAIDSITELKREVVKLQSEVFMFTSPINPWQSQHGGKHYAELTIQPLQYTLGAMGYEAFKGACHNHVARYTTRKKDNEVEQLKKAKHILELWIYETEKRNNLKGK